MLTEKCPLAVTIQTVNNDYVYGNREGCRLCNVQMNMLSDKRLLAVTIQTANNDYVYGNREVGCFFRSED